MPWPERIGLWGYHGLIRLPEHLITAYVRTCHRLVHDITRSVETVQTEFGCRGCDYVRQAQADAAALERIKRQWAQMPDDPFARRYIPPPAQPNGTERFRK